MKKQICSIISSIFLLAILCTAVKASAIAVTEDTAGDKISSMQLQPPQLAQQTGNETINLAAAVIKVIASLALVVGIMFLLTYFSCPNRENRAIHILPATLWRHRENWQERSGQEPREQ